MMQKEGDAAVVKEVDVDEMMESGTSTSKRLTSSSASSGSSSTKAPLPQHDPTQWAITFDQLLNFRDEAQSRLGRPWAAATMRDICSKIMIPKCQASGQSVALTLNPQGLPLEAFITHCWDEPFFEFVDSIQAAFSASFKKPNLWICAFALKQDPNQEVVSQQIGASLEEAPFLQALKAAQQFVIVRNPKVDLYHRIWCICELLYAKELQLIPDKSYVVGKSPPVVSKMSCVQAEAFCREDKEKILADLMEKDSIEDIDKLIEELRRFPSSSDGLYKRDIRVLVIFAIVSLALLATAVALGMVLSSNGAGAVVQETQRVDIISDFEGLQDDEVIPAEAIPSTFKIDEPNLNLTNSSISESTALLDPTLESSENPTAQPGEPEQEPTEPPSSCPSVVPTTDVPSFTPSLRTEFPTRDPSYQPTQTQSLNPTPSTDAPTPAPTSVVWTQLGQPLVGSVCQSGFCRQFRDYVGASVSMSSNGRILAVGAGDLEGRYDDIYMDEFLIATTFEMVNDTHWVTIPVVREDDRSFSDANRTRVNIVCLSDDGRVLAVGSPSWMGIGDVTVYQLTETIEKDGIVRKEWNRKGNRILGIAMPDEQYDDDDYVPEPEPVNDGGFGSSISLSSDGTILAVGAPGYSQSWFNKTSEEYLAIEGQVRVYKYEPNQNLWVPMGMDFNDGSFPSLFLYGFDLQLSGDGLSIVVGAPHSEWPNDESGVAFTMRYDEERDIWRRYGQALAGDGRHFTFGYAVGISKDGRTMIASTPQHFASASGNGFARVYRYFEDSWIQLGQQINGFLYKSLLGSSVAISGDGNRVIIGAPGAVGYGYGHVHVYEFESNSWVQVGNSILGETPGDAVAISGDGSVVAVTHQNEGRTAGHVSVYHLETEKYGATPKETLPPEIPIQSYELSTTEIIDTLADSRLTSFPDVSSLTALTRLILVQWQVDQVTGTIPTDWRSLSSLAEFEVRIDVTGSIPSEIGLLTSLTRLIIDSQSLTGSIPSSVGLLTKLTELELRSQAPPHTGTRPPQSPVLYGTLPTELGMLQALSRLDLTSNAHTGSIPTSFGRLTELRHVELSSNSLTGSLPSELGKLTKLTTLHLSRNALQGSLPLEFFQLSQLTAINLDGNRRLSGSLPTEIGRMTDLTGIYLADTSLTGSLPSELGLLTNMDWLYLYNTSFMTGTVPSELCRLARSQLGACYVDASKVSVPSSDCPCGCPDFSPC